MEKNEVLQKAIYRYQEQREKIVDELTSMSYEGIAATDKKMTLETQINNIDMNISQALNQLN